MSKISDIAPIIVITSLISLAVFLSGFVAGLLQDQEIDKLKWNQNVINQYLRCKEGLIVDCEPLTQDNYGEYNDGTSR